MTLKKVQMKKHQKTRVSRADREASARSSWQPRIRARGMARQDQAARPMEGSQPVSRERAREGSGEQKARRAGDQAER